MKVSFFNAMAYRYTDTDKWNDAWYTSLKPLEKLLFNYLCDCCDCAGFIEIDLKKWSAALSGDVGTVTKQQTEGALKGLQRGFKLSKTGDCIYLRNFLKHQKNLPLNPANKSHTGILRRFEKYKDKFDCADVEDFLTENTSAEPVAAEQKTPKASPRVDEAAKRKFTAPTLEEVTEYFITNGYSAKAAKKAYEHYALANWHDTTGKPVRNWRQKMNTVWFKDENLATVNANVPYNYYDYDQIVKLVNEGKAVIGKTHKSIRIAGRDKPVWVHVDEIAKYHLEENKSASKTDSLPRHAKAGLLKDLM